MCASYGLGGGPYPGAAPHGFEPMDERENRSLLTDWISVWEGKAGTTRHSKRGTNLNPFIHAQSGRREMDLGWWWFHIGGVPASFTAFNSRDDALMSKWRAGFQRRALLPATWYLEGKKRWSLPGGELFALAAILSDRTLPNGGTGIAYSLVTREGIGEASTVRNPRGGSRMPLALPLELHEEWLSPERLGDASLVSLVQEGSREISLAMTTGETSVTLF